MATITIIELDGYKDWNVSSIPKTITVDGAFDQNSCRDAYVKLHDLDEDEAKMSLKTMFGGNTPIKKGNVITAMHEEGGVVFVGS
jgi:hypothetical protein